MTTALMIEWIPEIGLAVAAIGLCLLATTRLGGRIGYVPIVLGLLALAGVAMAVLPTLDLAPAGADTTDGPAAFAPARFDPIARWARWFALAAGALLAPLICGPRRKPSDTSPDGEFRGERAAMLLLAVVGLMVIAAARQMALILVAIELITIPTYVLLVPRMNERGPGAWEPLVKYLILNMLASALFVLGLAMLYGQTGSGVLDASAVATGGLSAGEGLMKLALALILAGLGVKMTVVPFQFYAPDVYQGTDNARAALLAVLPKAAALLELLRIVVMMSEMPIGPFSWRAILAIAAMTLLVGNVIALSQTHLRRLMAYSSIAQTGFMLIPLVVVGTLGPASSEAVDTSVRQLAIGSLLFYLAAYSVATIGIFAALAHLAGGSDEVQLERLDQFAGLARTRPGMAAVLAILLLSLTGIPPTVGFWAKLHVLLAALTATGPSRVWLVSLVVIAAIAAVVAAGYCFRVIAVMYFRTPLADPPRGGNRSAQAVAIICAALVLALGLVGILARSVGYATLG